MIYKLKHRRVSLPTHLRWDRLEEVEERRIESYFGKA